MICRTTQSPRRCLVASGNAGREELAGKLAIVDSNICLMASNPMKASLQIHCKADLHLTVALPNSELDP